MIIFGIIGSVCTGLFGIAGSILIGLPEWAIVILTVLITGGMQFGLLKWVENEKEEAREHQKWVEKEVVRTYKDILETKKEEIAAAVHDLKEVDIDCLFCRNACEEMGVKIEECLQQTNCEKCTLDCLCKGCDGKSNYQWRGPCEENRGEDE